MQAFQEKRRKARLLLLSYTFRCGKSDIIGSFEVDCYHLKI